MKRKGVLMLAGALLLSLPVMAGAVNYTIDDLNSSATVDVNSQLGMHTWTVDGIDQLYQQWFWYRIGNGPEASIDTLNLVYANVGGVDGDPGNEILATRYRDAAGTFQIDISYMLQGEAAGSKGSDIAETITITNLTNHALEDFNFFQYTDFDLSQTIGDDLAYHVNENNQSQIDNGAFAEVIATTPSHWQIGAVPIIVDSLNDGAATILSDSGGGKGNMSFAFQWDFDLAAAGQSGNSFTISKDKRISEPVPEPSTMLLLGSGLSGLFTLGSLKKRKLNRKKADA